MDNDLKAAIEELAAAKATLAGAIETAREYYGSIKDDYPVIADDLNTKLQQAEGVLANAAAAIDEVNSMIELAGTALDAAKETVAAQALIDAIGTVEYTAESKEKIDAARAAYDALTDARKALVDPDAVTALNDASAAYALLENKAAFADYRETVKALADGMKLEGDSDACIALIETAKATVDALAYNESKTLDENKEALDDAAALTQLAADLAAQRAAEQADADQDAADAVEALINAIGTVAYTEESKQKIDTARDAWDAFTVVQKMLVENYDTLAAAEDAYAALKAAAGTPDSPGAADEVQICPYCGRPYSGTLGAVITALHGLIWLIYAMLGYDNPFA